MAGRTGRRIYKTKAWQRARLLVFRRDGWRCVLCGRRGGLECDHVKPIARAGDWFDLANLRTLCRGCHIQETARERRERCRQLNAERSALAAMALET